MGGGGRGTGRRGWGSIAVATGAGNASLGYPVTKLVRYVQRGPPVRRIITIENGATETPLFGCSGA